MAKDRDRWVWLDDGTGPAWRAKRESLGFNTREFAGRIGTSSGTISNVETEKQRRLDRQLYAKWKRALFRDKSDDTGDEKYKLIVESIFDIDNEEADKILAMLPIVKKPRKAR